MRKILLTLVLLVFAMFCFSQDMTYAEKIAASDVVVEASINFLTEDLQKEGSYVVFSVEPTTENMTTAKFLVVGALKGQDILAENGLTASFSVNIFIEKVGNSEEENADFSKSLTTGEQALFFFKKGEDGLKLLYKQHYL